ncbi:hypothetical protein ACN0YM_10005 [Staphylococcus cohnii]|uniref:hypothetical protein n=1 Tax=Staphylococcus cohnii TaxID=29382 RepID=UPI003AF77C7D
MERTIEKSLIWTGIAIHIIGLLLVTIGIIGMYTAPNGSKTDNTIIITYILTIIFLIIAIIVVTRIINDNKLAGILLIVLGVLVLIPNFISAILWLIAGIMLLTRKPKNNKYDINNRNKYQDGKKESKGKNVISNDPFEKKDSNSNPENKLEKEDVEDPFKY